MFERIEVRFSGTDKSESRTYSFLVGPGEVLVFFFVDAEFEEEIR